MICSGGTPKSTNPEFYNGTIPWLNTKEVNFSKIYETTNFITQQGLESSSAKWIPENSIIIAMYGATAAKVAISKIPLTTNQACCNLYINSLIADYQYIYYYLCRQYEKLFALANGGAQQNLSMKVIKEFVVYLPPLVEQKAIAAVLSALDDKIELNNRINKNLEAQTQAIFKSWFVDFEPFRDGEFVDSELGPIPKGWEIQTLKMCCDMIARGITPKYTDISDQIVINQKCIRDHQANLEPARYHVPKVQNEKWLKFGDVLVNSTGQGTLGRVAQWYGYNINITVDSHVTIVRTNNHKLMHYLGQLMISRETEIESMASGSTGQTELSRERLGSMSILLPDQDSLDLFSKIVEPMMVKVTANNRQSKQLAILRDTLLPKLMSGEIRVPLEV